MSIINDETLGLLFRAAFAETSSTHSQEIFTIKEPQRISRRTVAFFLCCSFKQRKLCHLFKGMLSSFIRTRVEQCPERCYIPRKQSHCIFFSPVKFVTRKIASTHISYLLLSQGGIYTGNRKPKTPPQQTKCASQLQSTAAATKRVKRRSADGTDTKSSPHRMSGKREDSW